MNQALLLVDLQNDFCRDGALAVYEGEQTVNIANQAINYFVEQKYLVIASKDWHPAHHKSFASQSGTQIGELGQLNGLPQVWWPDHCIANSHGAQFHPDLNTAGINKIIYKGQHPEIDSYSAFFDNDQQQQTELNQWLIQRNIGKLVIMGLATDFCVKFTVLDALKLGYQVDVLIDGCRGVNLDVNDSQKALQEMVNHGAKLVSLNQLSYLSD